MKVANLLLSLSSMSPICFRMKLFLLHPMVFWVLCFLRQSYFLLLPKLSLTSKHLGSLMDLGQCHALPSYLANSYHLFKCQLRGSFLAPQVQGRDSSWRSHSNWCLLQGHTFSEYHYLFPCLFFLLFLFLPHVLHLLHLNATSLYKVKHHRYWTTCWTPFICLSRPTSPAACSVPWEAGRGVCSDGLSAFQFPVGLGR